MNSISDPFIKRPVMTMLVYLGVVVAGVYSYIKLPVSDLPTVDYPVIQVTASYPGASPDTVAANVASPLEQQFLKVPGIEIVTSSSSQGNAQLVLQFHLDKSIDAAASDVQAAINQAQGNLPADLPSPPTFKKTNPNEQPMLYIGAISYSMTESQLYDFAYTQLVQRMQVVPGVSNVQVFGSPRAVRVQVDPEKLYSLGLSFSDVNQAVQQGTTLVGAGQLKSNTYQFTLQPSTQLEMASDYGKLIIAYKEGAPIYLRDVASVIDTTQLEDLKMNFWSKRIPKPGAVGIVLAVTKADGANAVEVSKGLRALLPQLQSVIPQSIQLVPIYDRADSIIASVHDVEETLLIAFVLVVLVVFLFLGRVGDTVIPAVALPMSLLMTFVVMRLCNYTLDNLSLMALTLSIGFLIDDAIVFLENMVRRMEAGESVRDAAFNGAKEISFTILAMTLSLAVVFIPLVGMSGLIGRIFRELGVTIVVAVLASGIVSLTLTPMMCARVIKARAKDQRTLVERFAQWLEQRCLAFYSPTLYFALRHWYLSVIAILLCLVGMVFFYLKIPQSLLPIGDSGFISGIFIASPSSSPELMREYQNKVDESLRNNPYVDSYVSLTGLSNFINSNFGIIFVLLDEAGKKLANGKPRPPIEQVNGMISGQIFQIPGLLPGIRPMPVLQISAGASASNSGKYQYVLYGLDKEKVQMAGFAMMGGMASVPQVFANVNPDLFPGNPVLDVQLNRPQASQYGVTATNFAQLMATAYAQNYSYLIKSDYLQYWVVVEAQPKYRANATDLDWLYFNSLTNQSTLYNTSAVFDNNTSLVPFRSVATTTPKTAPIAVTHFNGFTSITLSFDLQPGIPIGIASDVIEQIAGAMPPSILPPDITRTFQGEALLFHEASVSLLLGMLVAFFVMYIILGILYESYVHPLTVMLSIPLAFVGGLGTLWLFGKELSLYSGIGMFMLAGIVKKNGIMMIDFAIMRQDEGRTPYEAVHEASMERFRPIIMTTLAAFFGALPLAIGLGADAESRIPLGLTICGGLLVSQLITLYVTPVTYLGFEWLQTHVLDRIAFFARGEKSETKPAAPAPPSVPA